MISLLTRLFAGFSLLLGGAIFGLFYMWIVLGLDAVDPRKAIATVQTIDASVNEFALVPAFMGTPVVMALAALLAFVAGIRSAAKAFGIAALIYVIGGFVPTLAVNIPLIAELNAVEVPSDVERAQAIWSAYSTRFHFWNTIRTLAAGASLLAAGLGIWRLSAHRAG